MNVSQSLRNSFGILGRSLGDAVSGVRYGVPWAYYALTGNDPKAARAMRNLEDATQRTRDLVYGNAPSTWGEDFGGVLFGLPLAGRLVAAARGANAARAASAARDARVRYQAGLNAEAKRRTGKTFEEVAKARRTAVENAEKFAKKAQEATGRSRGGYNSQAKYWQGETKNWNSALGDIENAKKGFYTQMRNAGARGTGAFNALRNAENFVRATAAANIGLPIGSAVADELDQPPLSQDDVQAIEEVMNPDTSEATGAAGAERRVMVDPEEFNNPLFNMEYDDSTLNKRLSTLQSLAEGDKYSTSNAAPDARSYLDYLSTLPAVEGIDEETLAKAEAGDPQAMVTAQNYLDRVFASQDASRKRLEEINQQLTDKAKEIRRSNWYNPLFYFNNAVGAFANLRQGRSPLEAIENQHLATIQGDPDYQRLLRSQAIEQTNFMPQEAVRAAIALETQKRNNKVLEELQRKRIENAQQNADTGRQKLEAYLLDQQSRNIEQQIRDLNAAIAIQKGGATQAQTAKLQQLQAARDRIYAEISRRVGISQPTTTSFDELNNINPQLAVPGVFPQSSAAQQVITEAMNRR